MTDPNEQPLSDAERIVGVVADAVSAASPLAGPYAPIVSLGAAGIKAIFDELVSLGHGDAIKEALDAQLAEARHLDREALKAKHEHDAVTARADEPTVEVPKP